MIDIFAPMRKAIDEALPRRKIEVKDESIDCKLVQLPDSYVPGKSILVVINPEIDYGRPF